MIWILMLVISSLGSVHMPGARVVGPVKSGLGSMTLTGYAPVNPVQSHVAGRRGL